MCAWVASEQWAQLVRSVPLDRVIYRVGPARVERARRWREAVGEALRAPLGSEPLSTLARGARSVLVLADDLTRPTPQRELLPPLLRALNEAGVGDERISVLIALGTHRYMSRAEMRRRFGSELCSRVAVLNHAWRDPGTFADLGFSERGTPLLVNRLAVQADLVIAVGSIVPHIYAGWGGGAKMVMPGICSAASIGPVHSLAAEEPDMLLIAGRRGTACRREIEACARRIGLDFILNVVLDAGGACAWAGAGEPGPTHGAGVAEAERVFLRPIPRPADIAVVDARPATVEYWQGIKALGHAARGVRRGGTLILHGEFAEGIETTHSDFAECALLDREQIADAWERGEIGDEVSLAPLMLHAAVRKHCRVICLSPGLGEAGAARLGFRHAGGAREALEMAFAEQGASAEVGIVEFGGDVVPTPPPAQPGNA